MELKENDSKNFCGERVSSRQAILNVVNKLRSTTLLIHKKQKRKQQMFTVEKFDDIEARLEHAPRNH
jgi:hypothetical protein